MTTTLADLLPRAATDHPDAVAVVDGDRVLSYRELDEMAAAVARAVRAAGARPGVRVGLYLDKSHAAVAAVHGVLRTGAAYVPLDPKAPTSRLGTIAQDCDLEILVSSASKASKWAGLVDDGAPLRHVMCVDGTPDAGGSPSGVKVTGPSSAGSGDAPSLGDDDLAYVLYTSGSTGRPKGVMLTHGNGGAFVDWTVRTLGVTEHDRLSSHAPFHFDLSIFDLFASASTAAALHLVPKKATIFPAEALGFIEANELTIWYSVPSALSMMVERGGLEPGRLPSLRTIVFAGEVFPTPYLAALMAALPEPAYWNWYGPTETNVCTAYEVTEAPDPDDPPIPIGPPIDVVDAVVVDDDGRAVAAGVEGELLISGPTVTPGYWGDLDRTAERLVDRGPDRFYRTGDIVVDEGPTGFRFRGRRDHQVKSRGHRIELGEIEAALHRHPVVSEAAVVAVPDPLITSRLIAFVVAGDGADRAALLTHCRSTLPSYMVPEAIEVIDALPRTSTDKIDRVDLGARADDLSD